MDRRVYSVGQVNAYIKDIFSRDRMLGSISVRGEVSNCKYHSSGHIYFTLKDKNSVLQAVMFMRDRKGLSFVLREGMEVIVSGTVGVYERGGSYQLYAREITHSGKGSLHEQFERLKTELGERGLFSPEYKQPIPEYIKTLGVVTADTGAAIRDIINVTHRRNPHVRIVLYPAKVQGEGAADTIVSGIKALEDHGVDCIIVGRGGGSIEDLWAFNEEKTAQAIFDCSVPIISAVGHETDFTIADFTADMRAPTPSAAAELAVYEYQAFAGQLEASAQRMSELVRRRVRLGRLKADNIALRIGAYAPDRMISERRMSLDRSQDALALSFKAKLDLQRSRLSAYELRFAAFAPGPVLLQRRTLLEACRSRAEQAFKAKLKDNEHMLALYAHRLKGLSPLDSMTRGYAFVTDARGARVRSVDDVAAGQTITLMLADGRIGAQVTETEHMDAEAYIYE